MLRLPLLLRLLLNKPREQQFGVVKVWLPSRGRPTVFFLLCLFGGALQLALISASVECAHRATVCGSLAIDKAQSIPRTVTPHLCFYRRRKATQRIRLNKPNFNVNVSNEVDGRPTCFSVYCHSFRPHNTKNTRNSARIPLYTRE